MDTKHDDTNLAGYCGLYCGACDILRLYEQGLAESRTQEWSELPERLRKFMPFKQLPIHCKGCRSDDVFGGCAKCLPRACAKEKGVDFCVKCGSFPCWRTRLLSALTWLGSFEKKLPHQKTRKPNLERIGCVGCAEWLSEQAQAWRCPQCSTRFAWYTKTCKTCGRELDSLKAFSTDGTG